MRTHDILCLADASAWDEAENAASLWSGRYKIPWDDPAFSTRMLSQHLEQAHGLASRKRRTIAEQADWLHEHVLHGQAS